MARHLARSSIIFALPLILGAATDRPNTRSTIRAHAAAVEAEIWEKERAIYAARGRGDLSVYLGNIATDYLAWPPNGRPPGGEESLRALSETMATQSQELLEMTPAAFSLNGDAAIIYYNTHRTRMPNGAPVDERFEVIHSWVRQGGTWKLLGGMARQSVIRN